MPKPSPSHYNAHFKSYIDQVKEDDLFTAFDNQAAQISSLITFCSEEQANHAYAPGKWTLKELLQHIIDTERIFNYRALCIARKEQVSLPGFDENEYAAASHANERSWKSLVEEFAAVRQSSILLYKSFTVGDLETIGISNKNPLSVASTGFIIVGHFYHHKKIMEERYL